LPPQDVIHLDLCLLGADAPSLLDVDTAVQGMLKLANDRVGAVYLPLMQQPDDRHIGT